MKKLSIAGYNFELPENFEFEFIDNNQIVTKPAVPDIPDFSRDIFNLHKDDEYYFELDFKYKRNFENLDFKNGIVFDNKDMDKYGTLINFSFIYAENGVRKMYGNCVVNGMSFEKSISRFLITELNEAE